MLHRQSPPPVQERKQVKRLANRYKLMMAILGGTLLLGSLPAYAQLKVGFVNVPRLMQEAPQAQAARERIQSRFQPREKQLQSEHDALQKMQQKYQRNSDVMSQSERDDLQSKIQDKQHDLQLKQQQFQDDLQSTRSKELRKLNGTIKAVVDRIAKQGHYDLILVDGVAYVSNKVDLTERVLAELKKESKSGK